MVPSSPEAGIEQTMQKGCTFEGYTQVGNSSQGRGCKGKPSEEKIKNIILISTLTAKDMPCYGSSLKKRTKWHYLC